MDGGGRWIDLAGLDLNLSRCTARRGYHFWSLVRYLVGISAAVAAHSLLQLLLTMRKLVKKAPVIPSRRHAWVIFAGDQVRILF